MPAEGAEYGPVPTSLFYIKDTAPAQHSILGARTSSERLGRGLRVLFGSSPAPGGACGLLVVRIRCSRRGPTYDLVLELRLAEVGKALPGVLFACAA